MTHYGTVNSCSSEANAVLRVRAADDGSAGIIFGIDRYGR